MHILAKKKLVGSGEVARAGHFTLPRRTPDKRQNSTIDFHGHCLGATNKMEPIPFLYCLWLRKSIQKTYPRNQKKKHFFFDNLCWPQYWPHIKLTCMKIVVLLTVYPTQFTVCRCITQFFLDPSVSSIAPRAKSSLSEHARNRG